MKLSEAYNTLGIAPDTSPDDAKKQYRKLTKEFHPDINKDPGAEDKFKKINEAYKVISTGQSTDREDVSFRQSGFNPFDPFNRQKSQHRVVTHVDLETTISFKDSVLGCNQELKFNRQSKCADCDGQGVRALNNGCDQCGGLGSQTMRRGNMIFTQTCGKCYGQSQTENCSNCQSTGVLEVETSVSVNVPGGISNKTTLRMGGMGNFAGGIMGMDQYTDAHLHINVTPDDQLSLQGTDVVSNLEISLLEALRGGKRVVKTILGESQIEIKPMSRNKDEVIILQMGVNRMGNQRVILDVKYPKDVNNLIGVLDTKDI
jgi:molecular chaperone DnaJ